MEPLDRAPGPFSGGNHAPARRRSLYGEVVFAHREDGHQVGLDCLIDSRLRLRGEQENEPARSAAGTASRQPVHVRASGAYLWGVGTCLSDVVADWVSGGQRVPVEIIREGPGKGRLRASTDRSVAVLEVLDARDLDHQLARVGDDRC